MMNFSGGIGAVTAGICLMILNLIVPDPPFMQVYGMRVVDDHVFIESSIETGEHGTVADWRVTVVPIETNAPSCQTVPGQNLHEGWSLYKASDRAERTFTIDVWAWDIGCYERLTDGEHIMYVTWTPRDGGAPVTATDRFNVSKPAT